MARAQTKHRLAEAKLELERAAEFKSGSFEGGVFAVAGGSPAHSRIAANPAAALQNCLQGNACLPRNSDLRPKIGAADLSSYPDLSVICGPLQLAEGADDTVINPAVLFEALSASTEACDRGRKFGHCRQTPSLREYVPVSQKEPPIEQCVRQEDGRWVLNEATGLKAARAMPSLGVPLPLAGVFANGKLGPPTTRVQSAPAR